MALAVSLGVAMLLLTLATINGLGAQNARGAWMATNPHSQRPTQRGGELSVTTPSLGSPIWWIVSSNQFENQLIVQIDVAATGAHPLIPPGILRCPGRAVLRVAALAALLRTTPASELGSRFTGR